MEEQERRKLLELYAKASEPKELFLDLFEKIEKLENKIIVLEGIEVLEDNTSMLMEEIGKVKKAIPKIPNLTPLHESIKKVRSEIPKIPKPESAEETRDKIASLKGKERLSVFSLKDLEWLNNARDWLNTNVIGGALSFLSLSDTPKAYKNQAGKAVVVNSTEDGLIFKTIPGVGTTAIYNEIVSGSGTSFTLAQTPVNNSLDLRGAGQFLTGGGVDYTLSGKNLTMVNSWSTGDLLAFYDY